MAPPISYLNTLWGRSNSDFDEATSASRPTTIFSHAPARRSESPPQSRSPSPQRGSICDLPATRVLGYGQVMRAASDAGFRAPSRSSVKDYAERALPATPTSVLSVEEMTTKGNGRKGFLLPPTPASTISAHEVLSEDGRVRGVFARRKRLLPPPRLMSSAAQVDERVDSPTLGSESPAIVADGRVYLLDDCTRSTSSLSTRSTVDSLIEAAPLSPTWLRRMRKRAHWTLKWWGLYRED